MTDDEMNSDIEDELDLDADEVAGTSEDEFVGVLPDDRVTNKIEEFVTAWRKFAAVVSDEFPELEMQAIAYDPGVLYGFGHGRQPGMGLLMNFHRALNERIQELWRLREFFFEMVKISKQAGFYPEVRDVIAKAQMEQYVDFELDPEPHYVDHATQTGMYDPEGS